MDASQFSSSAPDGGNAAVVMARLISADDVVAQAKKDRDSLLGIMFHDEWQEHQFTAEQLDQQSLASRQQECEAILSDPSVAIVDQQITSALVTIEAVRELVGVGPASDSSLGAMIKEINYASALGMSDSDYEQLRDSIAIAAESGDLEQQDAFGSVLLPKIEAALSFLEDDKADFHAAMQAARRLAPELPA